MTKNSHTTLIACDYLLPKADINRNIQNAKWCS